MNIIVTNQNKDLIYGANIEIMKELNGVFQVSEIANSFNSIFYKKLIIDATALENFPKEDVLRKLAKTFDTEKLILFLPPNDPPPKKFLSLLVSINIYNFTDNIKGLQELVNKSNTYDDVKDYVKEGKLSMGHARALSKIEDQGEVKRLANKAINEGLSVREIEGLQSKVMAPKKSSGGNNTYTLYENIMREKIGTKVKISKNKIEIPFDSEKDLERILEIINITFEE